MDIIKKITVLILFIFIFLLSYNNSLLKAQGPTLIPTPGPGTCVCGGMFNCQPVQPVNCGAYYTPWCNTSDPNCLSCDCLSPTPLPPGTCKCIPNVTPPCSYAPFGNNCGGIQYPQCSIDQFGICQESCACVTATPMPTQPPITPLPTPKLGCGDKCQNSSECDQSPPQYLVCDPNYNLCESPNYCPICLGTISGNPGVCLDRDDCGNLGKNPNDGVGTCVGGGEVCCTNYTNVPDCQLFPIPPFYMLIAFTVNITSPLPNITYVTDGGPRCLCFSPNFSDPYHGSFNCTCSPTGLYTISARSLNRTITCSAEVNVSQPNPYPPCTGHYTQKPGECHFIDCPIGTTWDGINPPFTDTGCELGDSCCIYGTSNQIIPRPALGIECETNGNPGINTAIGCIPITSTTSFLVFILPWALGVGGGTAFVLIIVAGFLFMTSAGDPRKVRAAKELLVSAISGLVMIIFSVYILDLIGIRILRIPGL
jgi:hypothetical protein